MARFQYAALLLTAACVYPVDRAYWDDPTCQGCDTSFPVAVGAAVAIAFTNAEGVAMPLTLDNTRIEPASFATLSQEAGKLVLEVHEAGLATLIIDGADGTFAVDAWNSDPGRVDVPELVVPGRPFYVWSRLEADGQRLVGSLDFTLLVNETADLRAESFDVEGCPHKAFVLPEATDGAWIATPPGAEGTGAIAAAVPVRLVVHEQVVGGNLPGNPTTVFYDLAAEDDRPVGNAVCTWTIISATAEPQELCDDSANVKSSTFTTLGPPDSIPEAICFFDGVEMGRVLLERPR